MHFYIDHNQGHHKHVATPGDPSSAKLNQSLYAFWPQTLIGTYMSAWHIAAKALEKKGKSAFSLQNEMLIFHFAQFGLLLSIYSIWGIATLGYFLIAALLDETNHNAGI